MKKVLVIALVAVALFGTRSHASFGLSTAGVGPHLGLGLGWGAAFTFGAQGDIGFDFGNKWTDIHYAPSLGLILGGRVQFAIEALDVRWYPPLPETLPIKPYAGLGVPIFVGSGAGAGFNFMAGTDFRLPNPKMVPWAEMKLTGGNIYSFRIQGGMTFRFKTSSGSGGSTGGSDFGDALSQ